MKDNPNNAQTLWFTLDAADAARRLGTSLDQGLDETEATERLTRLGPNRLPEKKPKSPWRLFAEQFKSFLTLVLIGAAGLAGIIGDITDMVVILIVVLFNSLLGFWQEYRAEKILDALKKMLAHQSRVRRGGQKLDLASDRLVPGDMVLLEAGDRVPADGRLVCAHRLEIDESTLTGESLAVEKHCGCLDDADLPLAERTNLAFMNTVVTRGRGELLITGTGTDTEMGRLVGLIDAAESGPTPLQESLDHLGKRLALIAGAVVAVILAMGLLRGEPLVEIVLTSIALAVAAIPEGLPAVVTVTLAIGMYQMTRRGAIVKRLSAVETLGSTTVICSDKTGTLTLNQMTARALLFAGRRFAVTGEGYHGAGDIRPEDRGAMPDLRPLLLPAILCNDSRLHGGCLIGDPTEGALLALAAKGGLAEGRDLPRIAEIPFESQHKFMATFHRDGAEVVIFVKGAPDVLMEKCSRVLMAGGEIPLDAEGCRGLHREIETLGERALRVLAVASARLPAAGFRADALFDHIRDLTFAGLVGLMDPPRAEARAAIADCRRAGILVKMITGDHRITAAAIARELGLEGEVVTGGELDRMDQRDLAAHIEKIAVFARVAPDHKVKIVNALKERGHVVAMTGDGVNDAAALRNADIGIAMGRTGTDVTREAATMVLTDDNFATIVGAVHEGRTIYDNIVKFVRFQLSTNVGALLTVFLAPLTGLPGPFNPIQILWVNIIMDGPPAMALAFDPARDGIMRDKPRKRSEPILTGSRLMRLAAYGLTMTAGTLGMMSYALAQGQTEHYARTLAFTTFVLFQFFNVFNARVGLSSAFNRHFFHNGKLWLALAGVIGLQVLSVHWPPAQAIFHTTALNLEDWGLAVAVASSIVILDEGRKLTVRLLRRGR